MGVPGLGHYECDVSALQEAYGALPEGTDGGVFVEFEPISEGSGLVPWKTGNDIQGVIYGWQKLWFHGAGKPNTICMVGAGYDSRWAGYCDAAWDVQFNILERGADAGTTDHETGHQFLGKPGTDELHVKAGNPLKDLWCHEGPDTQYCIMGYDRLDTPGSIYEFCAHPSQQSLCHHLRNVRDKADPLP